MWSPTCTRPSTPAVICGRALAGGSIIGTFGFRGASSLARSGVSYLALGLSALLWLLAGALAAGVALVTVTGVLEGPAYSGSVALRQRSAPPEVRGQVLTTFTSLTGLAISAGAAVGGVVASARTLISRLRGHQHGRGRAVRQPARCGGGMTQRSPTPVSVIAAAVVTVLLWASAFVGIRYAGRELWPRAARPRPAGRRQRGARAGHARSARAAAARRALRQIVLCGVLWFAVYNVALNAAERRIDAGIAALLVNVGPIFIAVLAGLVLREGFPRLLLAGCAVAFAGAALIGIATSHHSRGGGWGAILCLIAARHLRGRGGRPEAGPAPRLAAGGDLAGLHGRGARLPALRARAGLRARSRVRARDRVDGLPRPRSRRRSASPPGPTRCRAPPPGGWARPPTSSRRSRCCWAG